MPRRRQQSTTPLISSKSWLLGIWANDSLPHLAPDCQCLPEWRVLKQAAITPWFAQRVHSSIFCSRAQILTLIPATFPPKQLRLPPDVLSLLRQTHVEELEEHKQIPSPTPVIAPILASLDQLGHATNLQTLLISEPICTWHRRS